MKFDWDPEKTIEPSEALRLIQKQFPELEARTINLLGAGWDNTAFVVNEEYIFRFPRRASALTLLETEWSFLPKLAASLPLPIPTPKWRGVATDDFSWPFIGYRMLSGQTACTANLSEVQREALAEPIAHFLAALHTSDTAEIAKCHIPADNLARINGEIIVQKIEKNFRELEELKVLENRSELEKVIEKSQHFRKPLATAVVHGDFYVRHLLLDEHQRLVGIIDWGDVHLGDPAIDLAIAHNFLPPSSHTQFRKAYGEIADDTWNLARLRAILSASYLLLFGHHSKDHAIEREARRALYMLVTYDV